MASHPYRIVNVFTRQGEAFTGNPLCVFERADSFSDGTMQALARQFNLSETTFILPAAGEAAARVRIFTPGYEMPFAGHPTLGTAHVCRALGLGGASLTLEMPAGIIPVTADQNRWTLTAPVPAWRELEIPRDALADALGVAPGDIGERPLWVKAGKEQLIIPLASEAAVRRVRPKPAAFADIRSDEGFGMAYVFAWRGDSGALARFFFSQDGALLEDPATGSATANLGGWCLAMERPLPLHLHISQGEMVDRPSSLYLNVDSDRRVTVGGEVTDVGRGSITL